MSRTRYGVALAFIVIAGTVGGRPAARAQQGGPYTDQQAAAGQAAYTQSCGGCHGRTRSGAGEAPPLAGGAFITSWGRVLPLVVMTPAIAAAAGPVAQNVPRQITWTFDRLDTIGGLPVTVNGSPKVIETPLGKAVEFNGVDDSMYIDQHPLAGAEQFTFEAIFRPDGGAAEQRWFHLAERNPATGELVTVTGRSTQEANARFLFELRVINGNQWCLDAFVAGPGYSRALLFRDKLHPTGQWYHVASTYDGKMFRSYVNGELQGEAELAFKPHGAGGASVGTRMNHVTTSTVR